MAFRNKKPAGIRPVSALSIPDNKKQPDRVKIAFHFHLHINN
jgi:hypothetical protein